MVTARFAPAIHSRHSGRDVSRRLLLRGLGGGGIVAALGAGSLGRGLRAAAQDEPATGTPIAAPPAATTFVLVHGAWAGAWVWRKLIPLLQAAGHSVYASTATGMGDRVHLADRVSDLDLDLYVTDVVNLLEFEDLTGVTLVGWSYGGMMITGVAERVPERLAQLVYLDAFVPADGESGFDVFGVPEAARAGEFFPVLTDLVGALTTDPADMEWLLAKLVPQPSATLSQPIRLGNPAATAVPHTFVHCTVGAIEPFAGTATRLRSDPGWTVRELADNHFAPINSPQATADVLLSLA